MPAMGATPINPTREYVTMTQPAQPAPPAHIPGLITPNGVTPNQVPGQPVPAAQPGTVLPAPPAQAPPVPVTAAVQAHPAPPAAAPAAVPAPGDPGQTWALPTTLAVPTALTSAPGPAIPGLQQPPAVPGLTPPAPTPAPPPATGAEPTDRGYPEGTPLEQMDASQREAYWKYHSRKWEHLAKERSDFDAVKAKADQYDQYVASQATETEKQIAAAKQAGYQEATARAAVVLVDAHVRAGLGQRLQPHQVEALASNLSHQHFLAADGLTVDAGKVAAFVNTVAPQAAAPAVTAPAVPAVPGALPVGVPQPVGQPMQPVTGLPRALPDLGQGAQTSAPLDKLEAGRQQARAFLAGGNR